MKTEFKTLPECAKAALKELGFHGSTVSLEIVPDCVIDLHSHCCFEGNRAFTILINLGTGEYKSLTGSFGGANPYSKTIVDDTEGKKFTIPEGMMTIKGEIGGMGSFAMVYLRPDNVVPGMLSCPAIDDRTYRVLVPHRIAGIYKREALRGVTAQETASAVVAGYLAKKGRGIGLTVNGRNAIEKYEKENPGKRVF